MCIDMVLSVDILSLYVLVCQIKVKFPWDLHWEKHSLPRRRSQGSVTEPITTLLTPKHPESGCFPDWFLGDIECFKCSDWITITIGA